MQYTAVDCISLPRLHDSNILHGPAFHGLWLYIMYDALHCTLHCTARCTALTAHETRPCRWPSSSAGSPSPACPGRSPASTWPACRLTPALTHSSPGTNTICEAHKYDFIAGSRSEVGTCRVRALPQHPRPLGFRRVQALRPAVQGAAVRRLPAGDRSADLGNAMDELMRHQPSRKQATTDAITAAQGGEGGGGRGDDGHSGGDDGGDGW